MSEYRDRLQEKRREFAQRLIAAIEAHPLQWQRGWYTPSVPHNGKTGKNYRGINALYLSLLGDVKGYKDARWVTFNQAKELGASVKSGERSATVMFWSRWDKLTKAQYDERVTIGMTQEQKNEYLEAHVFPVLKFYNVFNAEQCTNFPAETKRNMSDEELVKQNERIEQIIARSEAPISYDGKDRAYYNFVRDEIHLPEITQFVTKQDYYATALHEIAHSTGHESRLARNMSDRSETAYAMEELRAELASTFLQLDYGIALEGAHYNNHAAYMQAWLGHLKNNPTDFFAAAVDAESISEYISEHMRQQVNADALFSEQVDAVLSGADTSSTHLKVVDTPKILRDVGLPNLPILMTAKHLKSVTQESGTENMNYHGLGVKAIKKLPELLADPVMVMDSLTRDDSVVVVTQAADKENRPVIASVKLGGKGNWNGVEIDSNILTSAYGRNNFSSFMNRNLQAGTVLYFDKQKSQVLFETPGIQFPDNFKMLDSDVIIRKCKCFVNSESQKESESLTKEHDQKNQGHQADPSGEQSEREAAATFTPAAVGTKENVATVVLPEASKFKTYDKSILFKIPKVFQFSHFVFYVPKSAVLSEGDKTVIDAKRIREFVLNNNGQEVRLTAQELRDVIAGKQIGKSARRVAAGKNAEKLDLLEKNVPEELKRKNNWCVYWTKPNPQKGKKDKFIMSAKTGGWASCTDPDTWTDFETAVSYARLKDYDGLAYALDGNGVNCIDLDKCIESTKLSTELAKRVISEISASYTEISASGNGIHVFLKDDLLENGKYRNRAETKDGEIEVYDRSRFISMTGRKYGKSAQLTACPEAFKSEVRRLLGETPKEQTRPPEKRTAGRIDASDSEVVERIRQSRKGASFEMLYAGGDVTGDKSRDDYALLNMLAFFTDCNEPQMERIFKSSARYRESKGAPYLARSIRNACNTLSARKWDARPGFDRGSGKGK